MMATRPGSTTNVNEIYGFEIPSNTEWSIENDSFKDDDK